MIDAKDAVLNAFENIVMDKMKNFKGINDLTTYIKTSERFCDLLDNHMLLFATRIKDKSRQNTSDIAINTGILTELYDYGVTKEQLSNLKALADYMGAKYHRTDGKTIVEISTRQLETYLGEHDE